MDDSESSANPRWGDDWRHTYATGLAEFIDANNERGTTGTAPDAVTVVAGDHNNWGDLTARYTRHSVHSFVYKCRCHLTPKEAQQLPPDRQGVEAHDHDVYARMRGTSFHPPVLALPRKRVEDCALSPVPCDCKTLAEGADKQDRLKKLTKLADTLESLPHDFTRAVPALRGLIEQLQEGRVARPEDDAPPLKWLGAAPPERSEVPLTRNMYYEHLPDTSWQLLATFHRMPARRADA